MHSLGDHRSALIGLLMLTLLPMVALADPRPLGELVREWSRQLDRNFVLDVRLSLDTPVDLPSAPENLDQLDSWLLRAGLKQELLDNGDRLIMPGQQLAIELGALSVQDTRLFDASGAVTLAEQTASTTELAGDAITGSADRELDHLFLRVANVFGGRDGFYIRGIPRSSELNTLGNAGVFVDGVPLPSGVLSNVPVGTFNTAGVRFRRGADSGMNGPFPGYSGSVEIDYGWPGYSPAGQWSARYTDLDDTQLAAWYDLVPRPEELALRTSIEYQSVSGILDAGDGSRQDVDGAESISARIAARWEPVKWPGMTARLSALWIDGSSGPQTLIQSIDSNEPFDRQGGFAPIKESQVQFASLAIHGDYQSNSGKRWTLQGGLSDSRVDLLPSRPIGNEILPRFELIDRTDTGNDFISIGVSDERSGGGGWQLGFNVGRSDAIELVDRDRADWRVSSQLDRWSLTGGFQTPIGSVYQFQAGLRYDRDRLETGCLVNGRSGAGFAEDQALSCARFLGFYAALEDSSRLRPLRVSFAEFSPELSVSRRLGAGELFIRAYRGFNVGGATSSVELSGRPFWIIYQPEQTDNGEFGWQVGSDRYRSRLTAFYGSLGRQWTPILGGSNLPLDQVDNAGHSRHFGIEWDAEFNLASRHHLQASLGWLNSRFVNYLPFDRDVELVPVSGNEFPGAPEYSGSVSWRFDIDEHWQFDTVISHHAETFANADNVELAKVPASTLLDIGLQYQWRGLTLRAEVRNLLDENYLETTPRIINNGNQIEYAPGRPRTIGLILVHDF
jgi:hypothetical protein